MPWATKAPVMAACVQACWHIASTALANSFACICPMGSIML